MIKQMFYPHFIKFASLGFLASPSPALSIITRSLIYQTSVFFSQKSLCYIATVLLYFYFLIISSYQGNDTSFKPRIQRYWGKYKDVWWKDFYT